MRSFSNRRPRSFYLPAINGDRGTERPLSLEPTDLTGLPLRVIVNAADRDRRVEAGCRGRPQLP
jgi:hypothetical protein